ncbi:MAG TPA: hypothetical protein VGE72_20850 [Azospirillum sp.]
MRTFHSLTTRRLQALDTHRAAMERAERVCEHRLRRQMRGLNVVMALWAVALVGLWLWSRLGTLA